jgi:hypothetical protein
MQVRGLLSDAAAMVTALAEVRAVCQPCQFLNVLPHLFDSPPASWQVRACLERAEVCAQTPDTASESAAAAAAALAALRTVRAVAVAAPCLLELQVSQSARCLNDTESPLGGGGRVAVNRTGYAWLHRSAWVSSR